MLEGNYEENRVSKDVELTPQKNKNEQKQNKNVGKRNQEKWRIKEKMMKKEEEMNEGTTKYDLSCNDKNDPWSDHPETQFGPIYPFFSKP